MRGERDMQWMYSPILSFDVETTGLDPERDRVVQLAVLRYEPGKRLGEMQSWVSLFSPGDVEFTADAALRTGIDPDELKGKPRMEDCWGEILDVLELEPLHLAYNAPFDISFLLPVHSRAKLDRPFPVAPARVIDPLCFARGLYRYQKGKALGQMALRLGVPVRKAHDALWDSVAAAEVMWRMADAHSLPPGLDALLALQRKYATEWERFTGHSYYRSHATENS